ncbi:MAG: hypothetical protein Sapg2KO_36370 [Saprospiraceae bacterium]
MVGLNGPTTAYYQPKPEMMFVKIINTFLLLSFLAALVDCKSPQMSSQSFSIDNTQIEVAVGTIFKIELASNIGTGYSWSLKTSLDSTYLELIDQEYFENDLLTEEEESKEVWRFKGVKKGTTEIKMIYKRPWEEVSQESIEKTFTVKLQ